MVATLTVMAIVFQGVAWPKRRHLGKPGPKPCLLVAIWVVAQEIGSKWGADAPHSILLTGTHFTRIRSLYFIQYSILISGKVTIFIKPSSSAHILHSRIHNQEGQDTVVGYQEESHT
ncbi:hypothetical protein DSO57_1019241 [Entomophthora muscae]|uniref:Uncharacterized protein n=1 Tax=Entomophthora muscae TaxID=34485 RepID=A0ACC2UCW2_9FUNG|nr:hypothetical protein DSO57_1019241 [Entomophthora muscae]